MLNSKIKLRQQQLAKLKQLSLTDLQRDSHKLTQHLLNTNEWRSAQWIATTLNLAHEVITSELIEAAWQQGKQVAVPSVVNKRLVWHHYTPDTPLTTGVMAIREASQAPLVLPQQLELIVVPGLAFTTTGRRLGYGGGYFDRLLAECHVPTVALALPQQLQANLPWEAHDQLIDRIIVL